MLKKLLIISSSLSIIAGAWGACATSHKSCSCDKGGFNGFSIGLSAGYRIQTAKDKVETPKSTILSKAFKSYEEVLKEVAALATTNLPVINVPDAGIASGAAAEANYQLATNYFNENLVKRVNAVMSQFGLALPTNITWGHGGFANDAAVANIEFRPSTAYTIGGSELLGVGPYTANGSAVAVGAAMPAANIQAAGASAVKSINWGILSHIALQNKDKFTPTSALNEGVSTTVEASTSEIRSHNQQGVYSLRLGYGHSFAHFHGGFELACDLYSGKLPVKVASSKEVKQKVFEKNGVSYSYDGELPALDHKITLRNKGSLAVVFKPGLAYNNVLFYVPLEVNMTRYEVKFDRSSDNIKAYDNMFPSYAGTITVDGKTYATVNTISAVSVDGQGDVTREDVNFSKQKNRLGYAFGLGSTVKLNSRFSIDFRGTYSPNNKLKIDVPAYKSNALLDDSRLGSRHQIKLSSIKLALGFIWHVN
jgi:opacity protein-like surface antigen